MAKNMEQIEKTGRFGLIEGFNSGRNGLFDQRSRIGGLIANDQRDELVGMGFPEDMIHLMRLWFEQGPDVLASVSHPEEFDLDKNVALFNLMLYRAHVGEQGADLPRVAINHLDTIPIGKSVKKPLKYGNFGSDFDVFGVNKERTSGFLVSDARKAEMQTAFRNKVDEIAEELFSKMTGEIGLAATRSGTTVDRKQLSRNIRSNISQRLGDLAGILGDSMAGSEESMGGLLMRFNQRLMARVFESNQPLEDSMGFESELYSMNSNYRDLVRQSTIHLIDARGVDFLKRIVGETEGICVIEDGNGTRKVLTIKDGQYVLASGSELVPVGKDEVRRAFEEGKPLAKLESLALVGGGFTMHMGSERGIRGKITEALGVSGEAADYVSSLRVAEDGKHGNYGITSEEGDAFPPTPFLYTLMGARGIRNIMIPQIGRTNTPIKLKPQDFKSYCADRLVSEAVGRFGFTEMERGMQYGLVK